MTSPAELYDCKLPDTLRQVSLPCNLAFARMGHRLLSDDSSCKSGGSESISRDRHEEIGLERVETLGKESAFGQVTEKMVFPSNNPQSVDPSSQRYVTTPSNATSVVEKQQVLWNAVLSQIEQLIRVSDDIVVNVEWA